MKNKIRRSILAAFCAVAMMLSLVACGGGSTEKPAEKPADDAAASDAAEPAADDAAAPAEEKTFNMKLAHNLAEDHAVHIQLTAFAEAVKEKSNGTINIQIVPNGTLGSEADCISQIQAGALEMTKVSAGTLMGTAPALIRNYVELRGIGIINVAKLFGMGAIKEETIINLVINIVHWDEHHNYDRLGLKSQYVDILGVQVPSITVPVTPGRNLAVILEVAAMNNRQKRLGYNAAEEFTNQLNRHFAEAMNS